MKKKPKSIIEALDEIQEVMGAESIAEVLLGKKRRIVGVRKRRKDQ